MVGIMLYEYDYDLSVSSYERRFIIQANSTTDVSARQLNRMRKALVWLGLRGYTLLTVPGTAGTGPTASTNGDGRPWTTTVGEQTDLQACTGGRADWSTPCRTVACGEWWLPSQQCNRTLRSAPSLATSRPAAGRRRTPMTKPRPTGECPSAFRRRAENIKAGGGGGILSVTSLYDGSYCTWPGARRKG